MARWENRWRVLVNLCLPHCCHQETGCQCHWETWTQKAKPYKELDEENRRATWTISFHFIIVHVYYCWINVCIIFGLRKFSRISTCFLLTCRKFYKHLRSLGFRVCAKITSACCQDTQQMSSSDKYGALIFFSFFLIRSGLQDFYFVLSLQSFGVTEKKWE